MATCSILGGTGALGAALALRLARAGHSIIIGSRDPDKARAAAEDIKTRLPCARTSGGDLAEASAAGDVVFLTVPYAAHADTLRLVAPRLEGKVLVDATVPLRPPKVGTVQLPSEGAAALEAKAILGGGVRIVSALQTIGAEKLASGEAIDCDVLAASDDATAVEIVSGLLSDIGLRTWHVGPLANAAAAEALTSVLIQINRRYKIAQSGVRITGRAKGAPVAREISAHPVCGLPMLQPGDDLAALIMASLSAEAFALRDGDVLVVAQKAVSKVEGRQVALSNVTPTALSHSIALESGKPAEVIELIRAESEELMRVKPGVVIARHKLGLVAANAGIDASNVAAPGDDETVLLWPKDPDDSARRLRDAIAWASGAEIAVIVSDSLGRAWRMGTTGSAIGVAGMIPLRDRCGESDLFGRTLQATVVAVADEIAAAASLVIGEAAEGIPAAIVRGATFASGDGDMRALLRPRSEDLFP